MKHPLLAAAALFLTSCSTVERPGDPSAPAPTKEGQRKVFDRKVRDITKRMKQDGYFLFGDVAVDPDGGATLVFFREPGPPCSDKWFHITASGGVTVMR